jgi:hypothetical protein
LHGAGMFDTSVCFFSFVACDARPMSLIIDCCTALASGGFGVVTDGSEGVLPGSGRAAQHPLAGRVDVEASQWQRR